MSYGGQTLALDVKPFSFDLGAPLKAAEEIKAARTNNQILSRQNEYQEKQLGDEMLRDAINQAQDAASWDRMMSEAAAHGSTEASQYIGRYTPVLQSRLRDVYGASAPAAKPGGAGGGADLAAGGGAPMTSALGAGAGGDLDRAFENVPPDKMAGSLKKLDLILNALQVVRDQASWDVAVKGLVAAGIPEAAQFAGAYSPLRIQGLWNQLQPIHNYLQQRLAAKATGLPEPMVPTEIKEGGGGGIYAINPYQGGSARELVAPPGKNTYIGTDAKGQPIVMDSRSGATRVVTDTGPIQAKPSATGSRWKMIYDQAILLGHSPDDAMSIANGQKSFSPAEMRRSAQATAQKQYQTDALNGVAPTDPKLIPAYIKKLEDAAYNELATTPTNVTAKPAPGAKAPPQAGGGDLPDRARKMLKEGVPQAFANGQVWTLRGGKPVRLK